MSHRHSFAARKRDTVRPTGRLPSMISAGTALRSRPGRRGPGGPHRCAASLPRLSCPGVAATSHHPCVALDAQPRPEGSAGPATASERCLARDTDPFEHKSLDRVSLAARLFARFSTARAMLRTWLVVAFHRPTFGKWPSLIGEGRALRGRSSRHLRAGSLSVRVQCAFRPGRAPTSERPRTAVSKTVTTW
jgi:hypothetical protein